MEDEYIKVQLLTAVLSSLKNLSL